MGTRADFWVGRGESAEWIGSVGFDGYPSGVAFDVWRRTVDEHSFRQEVAHMLARRDDARLPENGWPWPWETSATTEWAYAFDDGRVWQSKFGGPWLPFGTTPLLPAEGRATPNAIFPKMPRKRYERRAL